MHMHCTAARKSATSRARFFDRFILAACRAFLASATEVLLAIVFWSFFGLILMDFDLLSGRRYAKRPSGGLRAWTASPALRRLGMAEPLPARRALQHLTRKARRF